MDHAASGHERMAALLACFETGSVTEEERLELEAHLLECDVCFAELERGSEVVAALVGNRSRWLSLLEPSTAPQPDRAGVRPVPRARSFFRRYWSWRPVLAATAVLVLLAVAASLRLLPTGTGYAALASFPHEKLSADLVRGGQLTDTVREIMETGAGYYDTGRYREAENYFRAALNRDGTLAEAAYLVGLCRIAVEDYAGAVPLLEKAAGLADESLKSRALWALANADLKTRNLASARLILGDLASGNDEYTTMAQKLLERLPR